MVRRKELREDRKVAKKGMDKKKREEGREEG